MPQERIFFDSYELVASPADDQPTVIARVEGVTQRYANTNIAFSGWAQFEVDPDTTETLLGVHVDDANGRQVGDYANIACAAATFTGMFLDVEVQDAEAGQVMDATYVLVLICQDATGGTTVSNVKLTARVS